MPLSEVKTYEVRCDSGPFCGATRRIQSAKDIWAVMGEFTTQGWMYSAVLDTVLCPKCAEVVRAGHSLGETNV